MGSRVRNNVKHFFECFCEIVPATKNKEAWIIYMFPPKYQDNEILKSVPQFTYPYKFTNSVVEHYSFVLTDIESKWTYGFCRHDPKTETAIVVLSYLPWHCTFYKFLDKIAVLMTSSRSEDLSEFLNAVYSTKISEPGKSFTVKFNSGESTFAVEIPKQFQLPSIPENRNLTEYYNAVDSNNMMIIFASMLYERRIIFTSDKLNRLSACVQSANDIIYPMIWQHIFIPVLPMTLIDYLLAPMPFLIGVPDEVMKKVNRHEIGDVVILNADKNNVTTPFDDLNNLPQEIVNFLKKQFKNKSSQLGDSVPRNFLRALVQLIGGYRDGLAFHNGQKITFDEEKFIELRPVAFQPFLREMLHLQIFQQFIEERLSMLNNGLGFSDEFEMETFNYSVQSGSKLKQQYKDWMSTMKKEGSAFIKSVKEKANPAVKSAVKTVKDGGKGMKSAYKGLKSRFKDHHDEQFVNEVDSPVSKPQSVPSSPTTNRRPLGYLNIPPKNSSKDSERTRTIYNSKTLSSNQNSRSTSPNMEFVGIDLMHEMQDLLNFDLDPSTVDRSLKPVRSLENFNNSIKNRSSEWIFPSRTGNNIKNIGANNSVSSTSTNSNFLLMNDLACDEKNLLTSYDDVLYTSPIVYSQSKENKDPFDDKFVVVSRDNENGDPLFLVANKQNVDIIKLPPPTNKKGQKYNLENENLIRLDSSSDIDELDPLKNQSTKNVLLSISNPLYTFGYQNVTKNDLRTSNNSTKNDQALLEEYGIDFKHFSNQPFSGSFSTTNTASSSTTQKYAGQNHWTTFD